MRHKYCPCSLHTSPNQTLQLCTAGLQSRVTSHVHSLFQLGQPLFQYAKLRSDFLRLQDPHRRQCRYSRSKLNVLCRSPQRAIDEHRSCSENFQAVITDTKMRIRQEMVTNRWSYRERAAKTSALRIELEPSFQSQHKQNIPVL